MELDDMKSAWAQYDRKLSKSLKLNEELLRKINVNASRLEVQKPLIAEIVGVVSMLVLTPLIAGLSLRFINEPEYFIPGLVGTMVAFVYLVFAIIKTHRFAGIQYYGVPVTKLQQDIAKVNQLVLRLRKYELLLSPMILTSLPVFLKAIHNLNVYSNPRFWVAAVIVFGIGFPATLWINKHLYDEKFRNTEKLLKEIEDYESETRVI